MAKSNSRQRGGRNRHRRKNFAADPTAVVTAPTPSVTSPASTMTSSSQLSDDNMYFDFETLGNSDEGVSKLFGE